MQVDDHPRLLRPAVQRPAVQRIGGPVATGRSAQEQGPGRVRRRVGHPPKQRLDRRGQKADPPVIMADPPLRAVRVTPHDPVRGLLQLRARNTAHPVEQPILPDRERTAGQNPRTQGHVQAVGAASRPWVDRLKQRAQHLVGGAHPLGWSDQRRAAAYLVHGEQHVVEQLHLLALPGVGQGQHPVGALGSRPTPACQADQQFEVIESGTGPAGAGQVQQGVAVDTDERPELALTGGQGLVGQGNSRPLKQHQRQPADAGVGPSLGRNGLQGELQVDHAGVRIQATGAQGIGRQRVQRQPGPGRHGGQRTGHRPVAGVDHGHGCTRQLERQSRQQGGLQVAGPGAAFHGKRCHRPRQRVESMAIVPHVLGVVPATLQDGRDHAEQQPTLAARTDGQVLVDLRGEGSALGAGNDDLRPLGLAGVAQGLQVGHAPEAGAPVGARRVLAQQQHVVGPVHVGQQRRRLPQHPLADQQARPGARGLGTQDVGGSQAEPHGQAARQVTATASDPLAQVQAQRGWTVPAPDLAQHRSQRGQRFVPGRWHEVAFGTSPQRRAHPVAMGKGPQAGGGGVADESTRDSVLWVPLEAGQAAVLDTGQQAAATLTQAADDGDVFDDCRLDGSGFAGSWVGCVLHCRRR